MSASLRNVTKLPLVISILAAALLAVSCGRRGDSFQAGAQMKAVSMALEKYIRTHGDRLPPFDDPQRLETTLLPYLRDIAGGDAHYKAIQLTTPVFVRPETGEPYIFNMALSGKLRNNYPHPETIVIFYESRDNYAGRLVAFLDGHHVWMTAKQWEQLRVSNNLENR